MATEENGQKRLPERLKEKTEKVVSEATSTKGEASKRKKPQKSPQDGNSLSSKPVKATNVPAPPIDPEAMFKEGWLKNVYLERPAEHIFTRFPPEPNGYLHLGHSKAIAVNFGFARYHGGDCYLRFDDSNPKAEKEEFVISIQENIEWLGFKPYKITYASDNFDRMYELAENLIGYEGAYVCHCTRDEIILQRGGKKNLPRFACPHRDRPKAESLSEFRAMRDGKYKAGEASLRMKQNLEDDNPQMWDLGAYRILDDEHHRTGNKWRIYPTYDFIHCLCDSVEGITHSLCTVEFLRSRTSYEWLCDAVKVYKPMQREYGRLNVTGTIMSKRKLQELVENGIVRGWDDPRLYTLIGLRRRGVPPGAILSFVNELGVSTALTNIEVVRFEQSVRKYLELTVPRLMVVLDPVPVIIQNLPNDYVEEIELPFAPKDPTMGSHIVPFTQTVYIDRSDFREVDSKDFFRMAPGKSVGLLKVPYPLRATSFKKDENTGRISEIYAEYEKPAEGTAFKKPKTYIQWVGRSERHGSPIVAEARISKSLFKSENPDAAEGGFLSDINEASEEIYSSAMVEIGLTEVRRRAPWPEEAGDKDMRKGELTSEDGSKPGTPGFETVRFQGLRVAYFCLDKDTTADKVVLNRIVSLKEDSGKKN